MDMLVSVPLVSLVFSTSPTPWSTSLNLLFFYITWSTLVLSHSSLKIEIVGATAIRIVFWLFPSLVFLIFDTSLPALSRNIKHNGPSALPPRQARYLVKTVGLALFNLVLETALQAAISLGFASLLKTPIFCTSTTPPLPRQMIKHIALLFTLREALTYYIHRHLLHPTGKLKPQLLNRLPSLHSQHGAHASHFAPFSLLLKADHPVPYLLHRFTPLYLPALALSLLHHLLHPNRPSRISIAKLLPIAGSSSSSSSNSAAPGSLHILTYLLFAALAALEETLAMSGYARIPGLLVRGAARRTALHYRSGGRGNYGAWGLLDWAHGTGVGVAGGDRDDAAGDAREDMAGRRTNLKGGNRSGVVDDVARKAAGKRRSRG
ncbi:hypothetical protein VTK26DRAFT_4741 [Humicola hyalothermophila]